MISDFITNPLIVDALSFALEVHMEQKRKYTGEPYINHPVAVASILSEFTHDPELLAAALLHDTYEDHPQVASIDVLIGKFGQYVALLVLGLANPSKPSDGNREARKDIDRLYLARMTREVKMIRLCDTLHNLQDLKRNDPDFAVKYATEKRAAMVALDVPGVSGKLLTRVQEAIDDILEPNIIAHTTELGRKALSGELPIEGKFTPGGTRELDPDGRDAYRP
jgi:(p)ppGpp synthase/HD superfamily hydrolase